VSPLAGPARKLLGVAYEPARDLFWSVFSFTERTAVVWLAVYVLVALCVYLQSERRRNTPLLRGFVRYLVPRELYTHRSARADYLYFIVDKILFVAALGTLAVSGSWVTEELLETFPVEIEPQRAWASAFITFAAFIAFDFAAFLWHFLTHRVPVLWAFHRVHHAVEVLTPISNYRDHPVDSLGRSLFQGVFVGVVQAAVQHLAPSARPLQVAGENVLYVPFFVFANARHSHVWLGFGQFWSRIFSSPAQHQCHHGTAPHHIDVNYGLVLSIWDWLGGTLYVPRRKEQVRYGLAGEERPFPTVLSMYLRPFADVCLLWTRRDAPRGFRLAGRRA
jgi:sterol desaturase/sphingolipid hydroxylase (fatty acid hydroxylase superfamily)